MNNDVIADLKQFIAAAITQQTSDLREDIIGLRNDVIRIDKKIDDISIAIAEALDTSNEAIETQLKDHEHRLIRLERKHA